MTIESTSGRAVVILSREELSRYGTDCARLSLADDRTRIMLGDMLSMLIHMGVVPDMPESVVIECACGAAGGCMLFFAVPGQNGRRVVRFSCDDAVLRAAEAGALTDDMTLLPDGDGYILLLPEDTEWWREGLIREFSAE